MESNNPEEGTSQKKTPFDNLTRDDLVKKCKGLLAIAQKAKQARDESVEENNNLKEEVSKYDTQKSADKECLKAMQELVDLLTEHKLTSTIQISDLQSQLTRLQNELKISKDKISSFSEILIENESLNRQIKRLTDENEDLITDMSKMEEKLDTVNKMSLQHQQDLLLLEKNDKQSEYVEKIKNLEDAIHQIKQQRNELFNQSETSSNKVSHYKQIVDEKNNEIKSLQIILDEKSNEIKSLLENRNSREEIKTELEEINEENNKNKLLIEKYETKLKLYKGKIIEINNKFKQLKIMRTVLLDTVKDYSSTIPKWQMEISNLSTKVFKKLVHFESENKRLEMVVTKLEIDLELKTEQLNQFRNEDLDKHAESHEVTALNQKINEMNSELDILREISIKYEQCLNNESTKDKLEKLTKNVHNLEALIQETEVFKNNKNTEILNLNKSLEASNTEIKKLISDHEIFSDSTKTQIENLSQEKDKIKEDLIKSEKYKATADRYKRENGDLLSEMKEVNQVLKERGEAISKQHSKITELQITINDNEKIIVGLKNQIKKHDEALEENKTIYEKTVKQLNDELNMLKNTSFETQSEILSTSTISRADESFRLKEIEDSFEEKYNKLRTLAVKLKKKVTEQSSVIAKLEAERNHDSNNKVQIKSLQNLQNENDKLLDELELLKSQQKDFEKLKLNLEEEKNKLLKVTHDVGNAEVDKTIKELKLEKEAFNVIRKELETEVEKLKKSIQSKEDELKSEKENSNILKSELEKTKATAKKTNVLSLEMDAYEKSLNETSQKLESKKITINELESTIKSHEESMISLKNQIKLLEEGLESEKLHSKELKQQMDNHQSKLKESDYEKSELNIQLRNLTKSLEDVKSEMDEMKLQLSQSFSDNEKQNSSLKREKEELVKQVFSFEDEINDLKSKLKQKEEEFEEIGTEFTAYKIRAQSVLRQNRQGDSSKEQELLEEISNLHSTIETVNSLMSTNLAEKEKLEKNLEEQKDDKNILQKRYKDSLELIEEIRLQNESLISELRKQSNEHQETLKTHRIQIDTINNCYKKQINELEEKSNKELENSRIFKNVEKSEIREEKNITLVNRAPAATDEQKIGLILTEREDGEGSESTSTSQNSMPHRKISVTRSRRDLIPLDELLNNSFEDQFLDEQERTVSPTFELKTTKDKLTVQDARVHHLASLLAEAEQDLTRLTQLNDVLKEEVRRQTRSLEREEHINNNEYLKNVIFKFITLSSGDEQRIHLVPVLNTILRLSPEENQKLQAVAKGSGEGAAKGLLGYLPKWSNH